jgi:heterodisulfide reductase subunit A
MEPKIGVYICHCGHNISAKVDIEAVVEDAQKLDNVKVARETKFMCSQAGQELVKEDIKKEGLNRVIVAACSPSMHEITFRKTCEEAGLNAYLLEIANIREQCSWVTADEKEATEKAKALIRAAISRVVFQQPLEKRRVDIKPSTIVVGGGIAGITAALKIADSGYKVYLVEREPSIGGHMARWDKTFPTLDCAACILTPRMTQVASHPNIELMTYSEVEEVNGYLGNFSVRIKHKARYVDEEKCNGCSSCYGKCPVKVTSEFDANMGKRKVIYTPFPQAVPNVPIIDRENCTYFKKGKCRACEIFCDAGAIDFEQQDKIEEIEVGSVIVATGYDLFNPEPIKHYGYGKYENVYNSVELERMVNASGPTLGHIQIKDGSKPESVAIIHCVGSRDENYHKYCSRLCCMSSLKFAHLIKEHLPETEVYEFYIDIRSAGKSYEEFYRRVCDDGVKFIRGKVSQITDKALNDEEKDKLVIICEDSLIGKTLRVPVDMVILSTAITPRKDAGKVARTFNISRSDDGFFMEKHPKLDPISTTTDGVFIAGCAQGPKDIPDTVAQAAAAAAEALALMSQGTYEIEASTAEIDSRICSGCQVCAMVCPYSAISCDEEKGTCEVNQALCKGCGACVGGCPSDAVELNHYTNEQIVAQMEGMLI